jgi:hypothetical protein
MVPTIVSKWPPKTICSAALSVPFLVATTACSAPL